MKLRSLITALFCIAASTYSISAQGTQTYNYASQSVGTGASFNYSAVNYDLSSLTENQSTSFTVTTTINAIGNSSYFVNLIIDGTSYQIGRATSSGTGVIPISGQLTLPLTNTSHSIVLQLFAGTATTFTTPALIVTPSDSQSILTDIATLQSTISSLNTALTSTNTDISSLQTDVGTLQTTLGTLQTQLSALDTAVAAIPTSAATATDLTSTESRLVSLGNAINDLNRQLNRIDDNSNPTSPTNLALSIGPAMAGILANAFISPAFDAPNGFDDEVLFLE